MKKFLVVMLCVITACFVLAGCSSKFEGKWKTVAAEIEGKKYTTSDETYGEMIKDMITIDVESDGKATFKANGQSEKVDWEADGDEITFKKDGDDLKGELKDDQLVLKMGDEKVYLEKDD